MIDFGYFYDVLLSFIGQIFGLFSWLGSISYSDFAYVVSRLWSGGDLFQYVNVITGVVETFSISGVITVLLSPFIVSAQLTVAIFNAFLYFLGVDYSYPMWAVCSIQLFITTTFMGIVRGVVLQFVKISGT